ncbi:hypothetical protein EPR50_G00241900 [Perca flavescens]|uniref:Uncharacterized protein n=1 Tax=Perca flavescens TaxID=8167 RepID=A0A484C313_PERFV|nr:hypothetical protein EPR50_G00241900 [Perca flavescens]
MIGRADIEGSKSDVAMNAWPPQASYPCGVPPQSNSPPATVPGAGHARRCRALDTRSESPLGARLPASPAARRQPRRPARTPRERGPAGAVAGEIREKGPARVQSRRHHRRTRSPPPTRLPHGVGHRPAKTPARRHECRRREPRETGRAPRFQRRREEGDGATAPPAAARAQPRFATQPDRPSP